MTAGRACIVGAGFGGLALAIRLQSAGVDTTIVEARDKPGGRAYYWERDGFVFDAGPTVITDPSGLEELWALSGDHISHDVEMMPVNPFYRLNWPDGTNIDWSGDEDAMERQIARISPSDVPGYRHFMAYSERALRESAGSLDASPFQTWTDALRAVPAILQSQAWRSLYGMASRHVRHPKLREALTVQALFLGSNPRTASALYAQLLKLENSAGVWWARGGTNRLVAGMVRLFERLGGALRLHDPVVRLHTLGNRITEVETQSGWRNRFDAVASNADLVHTYRDLLAETRRGQVYARRLARKRHAPGVFSVHFGVEGSWPGIPHHTVLFGPRYEGLLDDIYQYGVLPQDFAMYLHHPTVTDPSMAPEGKSAFSAAIPVAHMGKLAIDWEQVGPLLEKRILDEVGRRLITDIHDRIVTRFHYAPRDFALDLNAHMGTAFGLESSLSQSAWLRPPKRDQVLKNFYLVGAGTHPGAGIRAVIGGAGIAAGLMLEDLRT